MSIKLLMMLINRTWFSFWVVCFLSRVFSAVYVKFTKRVAPLPALTSLQEVEHALERISYYSDEFKVGAKRMPHFWMRTAGETQWILDKGLVPFWGQDCDEYALYAVEALRGVPEAMHPMILTVRWTLADGTIEGHNVAVYGYITQDWRRLYGHMGNWGHFRGFNSFSQIAQSISKKAQGKLLAYALASPKLDIFYHEAI